METIDITIIGAGVVGLAIAAELAEANKSVYILERHKFFGQETSSRNSEVIHAGIYYPKNTLKAKLCVEGNKMLYNICQSNNIPYKKTGKLIVATDKSEIEDLNLLFQNGLANGVNNLKLLSEKEFKTIEPNIEGIAALYSPSTGILDSHLLMKHFLTQAQSRGAEPVYNSEVTNIEKTDNGYKVTITNNDEDFSFITKILINSAGLNSDTIAEMVGIDTKKENYDLKYCKGQYFRIKANKYPAIAHLIYPVVSEKAKGLGIHITLSLDGGIRLGPDTTYIERDNIDYSVDEAAKEKFYTSTKRFIPLLEKNDVIADTSGIRPKLQGQNDNVKDFVIRDETDKGFPGFINLIGIESPGLTASPAIAEYVKTLLL